MGQHGLADRSVLAARAWSPVSGSTSLLRQISDGLSPPLESTVPHGVNRSRDSPDADSVREFRDQVRWNGVKL